MNNFHIHDWNQSTEQSNTEMQSVVEKDLLIRYQSKERKRKKRSTWNMCVSWSKLLSAKHTHYPVWSVRCFIRSVSKVFCSPKTECVLQFTRLWFRNSLRPSTMYGTKRSIALQKKKKKKKEKSNQKRYIKRRKRTNTHWRTLKQIVITLNPCTEKQR